MVIGVWDDRLARHLVPHGMKHRLEWVDRCLDEVHILEIRFAWFQPLEVFHSSPLVEEQPQACRSDLLPATLVDLGHFPQQITTYAAIPQSQAKFHSLAAFRAHRVAYHHAAPNALSCGQLFGARFPHYC